MQFCGHGNVNDIVFCVTSVLYICFRAGNQQKPRRKSNLSRAGLLSPGASFKDAEDGKELMNDSAGCLNDIAGEINRSRTALLPFVPPQTGTRSPLNTAILKTATTGFAA